MNGRDGRELSPRFRELGRGRRVHPAAASTIVRSTMSLAALLLLALGLAMDATAVSGARGLAAKRIRFRDALLVALFFGGFQAAMPAIGWALGAAFAARISGWGHWVTFVVLGGIGVKMMYEALKAPEEDDPKPADDEIFGLRVLALLAIATSIDALAAGVALAVANVSIVRACIVIGAITAALSFAGVHVGHRFGKRFGKRLEVVGGVVLIGLGVKSVVDHFMASS
jgi:putative Mn2+ efflux pump MntP